MRTRGPTALPRPSPAPLSGPVSINEMVRRVRHGFESITRRTVEMFERHPSSAAHPAEAWWQAEAASLHPLRLEVSVTGQALTFGARVPAFAEQEALS